MKKVIVAISFLFLFFSAYSQPCPDSLYLTSQAQIDSFPILYPSCTEIEGDVVINGSDITNLNGLSTLSFVGGNLDIGYFLGNVSLTNLIGLDNVTSVGGNLRIWNNDSLISLTGLDSLNTIGGTLLIGHYLLWGNQSLHSLQGLNSLEFIGGDCYIHNNPNLISLTGLENLDSITGSLEIGNPLAGGSSNYSLKNLDGLNPDVFIGSGLGLYGNDSLTTLTTFNNVNHLERLEIWANGSLQNLTGLEKLESISGHVFILSNYSLNTLTGLDNLTTVGDYVRILSNNALSSLTGLDNLNSVGGDLSIGGNPALTNLTGLDNVTSVGGDLSIGNNNSITSLTGLDNIDANSIEDLYVIENQLLSSCEVESVCAYLASPNGDISIYGNAIGCNSPKEVQDSCEANAVFVDERYISDRLLLYPNPASQKLNISAEGFNIDRLVIYSLTGQQLYFTRPNSESIDISALRPGMYIVEVMVEGRKIRQKLIIQ